MIVSFLTSAIQTESYTFEPPAVCQDQRVDLRKCAPVTNKTERVIGIADISNDVKKLPMKRRLAACEAQMVYAALLSFAQYLLYDFEREVVGCGVPLLKAVLAPQIAPVR
jgi:hypothetical protein